MCNNNNIAFARHKIRHTKHRQILHKFFFLCFNPKISNEHNVAIQHSSVLYSEELIFIILFLFKKLFYNKAKVIYLHIITMHIVKHKTQARERGKNRKTSDCHVSYARQNNLNFIIIYKRICMWEEPVQRN